MNKRKVCVVTGSRADYGLLSIVMEAIRQEPAFKLQVVVTGMHLSPEFGLTINEIAHDGFVIDAKVEMLLSSDTPVGIAKSIGLGLIGFADVLNVLQPDLMLLLGDRFEIMAAAQAALVAKIPVAHIAGGDTTEGAFDEAIRHCITKMAHLHFVTNDVAARRIRQMGENPGNILTVGSPGIDRIKTLKLLDRMELERELDFIFLKSNILVTYHPVTLETQTSSAQFRELLNALDLLGNDVGLIFTKPNADTDGRAIVSMIDEYVSVRRHAKAFTSLGQLRYLSLLSSVDVVVGNSSSGLYEVPSFKKPTVNIGDRQRGRLQASSVINCLPESTDIASAIRKAFIMDCSEAVNPYGQGDSAHRIVAVLRAIPDYRILLKKHFFDCLT